MGLETGTREPAKDPEPHLATTFLARLSVM